LLLFCELEYGKPQHGKGTNFDKEAIQLSKEAAKTSATATALMPKNKGMKKFLPSAVYEFFWSQPVVNVYTVYDNPHM
jgi:hypothetical protein